MKDDDRIRFIFGKRRKFSRASAAAAFDRSVRWIESNRFSRENGDVVAWEEMVLLADRFWTTPQIQQALGDQARRVYPALQLLRPLTVNIPVFKAIWLREEAHRTQRDVSDLVNDRIVVWRPDADRLDLGYPGFWEAWRFPYRE